MDSMPELVQTVFSVEQPVHSQDGHMWCKRGHTNWPLFDYRLSSVVWFPKAVKAYCLKLQCIKTFKMLLNVSTCSNLMVICMCLRSFLNQVQEVLLPEDVKICFKINKEKIRIDFWSQIRNMIILLTDFTPPPECYFLSNKRDYRRLMGVPYLKNQQQFLFI